MKKILPHTSNRYVVTIVILWLALCTPADAQGLGLLTGDSLGRFSMGLGAYQAPNEAISDSGVYTFARYEISNFEFEIDYGFSDHEFFLGAADYLYQIPTASGITQTDVALGGGVTFINNDPSLDKARFGPNILGQVRFADTMAVQLRYDFLGDDANLWTFGLSYSF